MDWYRVFNRGRWDLGGRYYSPIQNLPKELRAHLRIDGQQTVEYDFSGMHIRLLYAREGIGYEGDPYETAYVQERGSQEARTAIKVATMVALNAETRSSALGAINEKIRDGEIIIEEGDKAEDLLDSFIHHHPKLKKYMHSGVGLELQNMDAKIAYRILNRFISEKKPVICLHDGFISRKEDELFLKEAMSESFFLETGVSAIIKRER